MDCRPYGAGLAVAVIAACRYCGRSWLVPDAALLLTCGTAATEATYSSPGTPVTLLTEKAPPESGLPVQVGWPEAVWSVTVTTVLAGQPPTGQASVEQVRVPEMVTDWSG